MKPKYLLFTVIILLIFIATYINLGAGRPSAEVTNTQKIISSLSAKSESTSLKPSFSSMSSSIHIDTQPATRFVNITEYASRLPLLKVVPDDSGASEKSITANRLAEKLYARLREDISHHGEDIDKAKWRSEFAEVQKLLIESATQGEYLAALQLTMFPPVEITDDKSELIAWSLIADKMAWPSGSSVQRTCSHFSNGCSPGLMDSSLERALTYIDLYKMKATE